jgi:hypothetical protein
MYGVVTNNMYHEYMHAARAALGASVGLSMEVPMEPYGIAMATTSFTLNIKRWAELWCACRVPQWCMFWRQECKCRSGCRLLACCSYYSSKAQTHCKCPICSNCSCCSVSMEYTLIAGHCSARHRFWQLAQCGCICACFGHVLPSCSICWLLLTKQADGVCVHVCVAPAALCRLATTSLQSRCLARSGEQHSR